MDGVIINHKLILSLLSLILILSVSSVSAGVMVDGNSLYMDNNEFSDLSDNLDNLDLDNSDNLDLDNSDNLDLDNSLAASYDDSLNEEDITDNPLDGADALNDGDANEGDGDDTVNDGDDNEGDGDDNEDDPILKNTTLTIISKNNWKIYGEKNYTVKLLDEDNNPVVNASITFKIKNPKGKYISKSSLTDERGIAILHLNLNIRGIHNIQVSYKGSSDYNPAETVNSNVMFYEKTSIKTSFYAYRSCNLTIKLVSKKGDLLANKKIIVYVDKVRYTRTTDSKGRIYIKMPSNKRIIKLNCTFSASDYYEKSNRTMKLPVYKKTYTKPLVYVILKGKYFKVLLKGTDGKILKGEKVKISINGKTFTRTTNKKGIAYLKVNFKRNVYKVSISYGNNSIYGPSKNSSNLEVIDRSGQFKKGLNQMTKLSVSKYLYGGGYAKLTKYIKKLSKRITGKYTTKLEKATAIYNYVRDNLDYEYYPNSRKGASKTLKTKSGNCCDHTNLIVALCRASNIPARYAHAQGCRFVRSGHVEGHVWAQIYVGGKWYSADGTSYRNSLGHINNWDTRSYNRLHIYRNIPF